MKRTLLLVFIHGFKGSDNTFEGFPQDLRKALAKSLPKLDILTLQYPKYETRGDLRECVAKFKEWLQNKVIDLEVANSTPSPTVDPSVHVILCGHSMGGIVAAETLLSIANDEPVPRADLDSDMHEDNTTTSNNDTFPGHHNSTSTEGTTKGQRRSRPATPDMTRLFFPYVQGVMAFDTPYLGISPGVLAHGAEEQIDHASKAYKAFDTASTLFGWKAPTGANTASAPIADASARALPAASTPTNPGWGRWSRLAMYGGAAAAIAGAAGAAYLNRNQIMEGFAWAGSHLEFVGCLARGAELQRRVEGVVRLTRSHKVGFVDFYTALDEKVTNKTKYAGAVLGEDRTFCVIPKNAQGSSSPSSTKRNAPTDSDARTTKRRKSDTRDPVDAGMEDGQRVHDFAEDTTKSKGLWIKCMNSTVKDEITAHRAMFTPSDNSHYSTMLPMARDRIVQWIDQAWYESSSMGEETEPTVNKDDTQV